MNKCRCFNPPEDTPFEKEGIYRWNYIIDGYVVYHDSGFIWSSGELEFYFHFQKLSTNDVVDK